MPYRRRHVLTLGPVAAASALATPAAAQSRARAAAPGAAAASASPARAALALADAARWQEAMAAAAGADPLIGRYIAWLRASARNSGATAAEMVQFALAHPHWPGQDTLTRRIEEALATEPDDSIAERWFAQRAPRGLEGYQRLADVLIRLNRGQEAVVVIRRGWAEAPGDALVEPGYLERNAGNLTPEEHWRRFDRTALLRQGAPARIVPLLAGPRQAIAAARLAYAADAPDADAPGNAAAARGDLGLTHERARWLRRRERDAEAAEAWAAGAALQKDLPPDIARAIWAERQVLARKLVRLNEPRLAYRTASEHGQHAPGEPRQDAEFLAGFIALRRLNEAGVAERHFVKIRDDSNSLITRARSFYWQGRAAHAQGATQRARESWQAAAALPLAFYGQLAALTLGEDGAALAARIRGAAPPAVTPQQLRDVDSHELTRTALALAELGEARRARPLLVRLEELAAAPPGKLLVARVAQRTGRADNAVWVVRRAGAHGLMAREEGWPAPYPTPDDILEAAIVNAITRQESNFDPQAVSPANARGLMQLLPGTGQEVARRLGMRIQTAQLTQDPALNMRLGATYLSGLLSRFGDALPLAAAGYNAGPRRVDDWVAAHGDPRGGEVAMLDWMELIPIAETRNYVQRVMENVGVYRAADPAAAALSHPMARWIRDGA